LCQAIKQRSPSLAAICIAFSRVVLVWNSKGHALHVYALLGIEYSSKLGLCGASEHQADLIV
jgi:hypothetical protein